MATDKMPLITFMLIVQEVFRYDLLNSDEKHVFNLKIFPVFIVVYTFEQNYSYFYSYLSYSLI